MSLKREKITLFSKAYRDTRKLYISAFPVHERFLYFPTVLNSYRALADFYAYYDGDRFVGLAYVISSDQLVFLLFLAVTSEVRSKGYGKAILDDMAQLAKKRPVVLTIEPVEAEAKNYEQRLKRLAFYERNGYHATPHFYYEGREKYQILTNQGHVDIAAIEKLVKKAVLHLIPIRVE